MTVTLTPRTTLQTWLNTSGYNSPHVYTAKQNVKRSYTYNIYTATIVSVALHTVLFMFYSWGFVVTLSTEVHPDHYDMFKEPLLGWWNSRKWLMCYLEIFASGTQHRNNCKATGNHYRKYSLIHMRHLMFVEPDYNGKVVQIILPIQEEVIDDER